MSKKNPTFEENMQRIEQIVHTIEQGDIPLNESLKLFQEGTDLVRKCQELLDNAELQVKEISKADDGTPTEGDFNGEF